MSMSGGCSSSSATSATAFTKSIASAKSSNSNVRSMCFFSSSHSGIFFMPSFSSGAFIKSAITGQRVTPENRFATPKRAGLKSEDFPKIYRRIEHLDRARAGLARAAAPVCHQIFNRGHRSAQVPHKMKTALARKIFSGAAVFGDDWSTGRQKSGRPVAQPASFPAYVHALDCSKFGDRAGQILPVFLWRARDLVRIDNLPAMLSHPLPLGIIGFHVHGQFKAGLTHAHW